MVTRTKHRFRSEKRQATSNAQKYLAVTLYQQVVITVTARVDATHNQRRFVDARACGYYIGGDAALQQPEALMPSHSKSNDEHSPLGILTELAVEGTSSLAEAQRALLDLAQRENDIILNGVKERVTGFFPAVAMTDLVRRSVDTLIGMQQELLTSTSKQTLEWLQSEKEGKGKRAAHLVEFAREGVETFARTQKKFLELVAEESEKATKGKAEHEEGKAAKKTELAHLGREAGTAFIEAQKRLLDVMGQQINVNLDATTRAVAMMSPARLAPVASRTREGLREFVNAETSLIGSIIKPRKTAGERKPKRTHKARQREVVPA